MIRSLFLLFLLSSCASSPTEKENLYQGEALSEIGENGVLVGHAVVPMDVFPYDRKTTIFYFENIKTKINYQYGDTKGPLYMKLPPGDYVIKELWTGGGCNTSTGTMISSFFSTLPAKVQFLRDHLEKPASQALGFTIQKGKMTDIGNVLMTCFEWDLREKYKNQFTHYISGGKFQIYRPLSDEQHDCGCKILRKRDGVSIKEMKRALGQN